MPRGAGVAAGVATTAATNPQFTQNNSHQTLSFLASPSRYVCHVCHFKRFFTSCAGQVLLCHLLLLHQVTFTNLDPNSPDLPNLPNHFGTWPCVLPVQTCSKPVQTWFLTSSKSVHTRFKTSSTPVQNQLKTGVFLPRLVFVNRSFTCYFTLYSSCEYLLHPGSP